jgi:REP element-mobilizing transposase RayT
METKRKKKSARRTRMGRVSVYEHHGAFWIYYTEARRKRRVRIGPDRDEALRVAGEINAQLLGQRRTVFSFEPVTVDQLADRWLDHHEHIARSSLATVRRYRTAIDHLRVFSEGGSFSGLAHELPVERFVRHLREKPFSPNGHENTPKAVQPPRETLRRFQRAAGPRLEYSPIWLDDAKRQAIGDAFARVVEKRRYTVWACAILKNHAHLCVRRHRDDAVTIWRALAEESSKSLRLFADVADDHPVWSNRPYKVFLYDGGDVRRVTAYILENPVKESLGTQRWPFVSDYDGFPGGSIPSDRQLK